MRSHRRPIQRANGAGTAYGYNAVSRLSSLSHDLSGTSRDVTFGYGYNPASQLVTRTSSNDAYSYTALANANVTDTHNGLNQLTAVGSGSVAHDARGNTTSDPTNGASYSFSSENLLTGSSWGTLSYDPLTRLYDSGNTARTRVLHDGQQRIAEYNQAGTQTTRFLFGPGMDEPLVQYTGSGVATRQFLHADERGSIVGASDGTGASTGVGTYDDYGRFQSFAGYRFGYAGQPSETVSDLQYARARFYNPRTGRFAQTDPIGYGDGMNLYPYVGGDPVNRTDPLGLFETCASWQEPGLTFEYTGSDGTPGTYVQPGRTRVACWDGDAVRGPRQYADFAGGGGGSGKGGEPASTTERQCQEQGNADRFRPLSPAQSAQILSALSTPSVAQRAGQAWNDTIRTGRESGFLIYRIEFSGTAFFYPGTLYSGHATGFYQDFAAALQYGKRYFAFYHTHPGGVRGFSFPSQRDTRLARQYNSVAILRSQCGTRIGR